MVQLKHIPTTALLPGLILELIVQLCCVQLPHLDAVHLETIKRGGTFPVEKLSHIMVECGQPNLTTALETTLTFLKIITLFGQ